MTFPYEFHLLGLRLHPHAVMEICGYTGGSQLYFFLRRREKRLAPPVPIEANLWLLVGCVFGALFGAKILALLESWREIQAEVAAGNTIALLAGKTIVGGLLGGWIGVEIAKRIQGIRRSTGDLFVFPLIIGIALGRVGCFLTGLADHTCGIATNLPWGIDFGDGIRRHPTQLYEIFWLLEMGVLLTVMKVVRARKARWFSVLDVSGSLFRLFLIGYFGFRFFVEFIKPSDKPLLGLSAIQATCLVAVIVCVVQLIRSKRRGDDLKALERLPADNEVPPTPIAEGT
jgi:prolipoprotein diacylglyceryltransferase